jgi:hypothetical protein
MGFDFYIWKVLHIYYGEKNYLSVKIGDIDGGYYYWDYDEDDENYDFKVNEYKKWILTPQSDPIILYNNGKFNMASTEIKYESIIDNEIKYKSIIDNEINKHNINWIDITKIIKTEERYERG